VAGGAIETATITVGGGVNIGVLPFAIFVCATALIWLLDALLYHPSWRADQGRIRGRRDGRSHRP
jgi:hypothetical protein